ncbi:MAG: outer membrane lipoprotein carrier protein LolA [Desulfobacterota bacterium]|nr:outer membrane lipoprotein carrier protein LolA [Thermodesulfobacteriota bacterium]
MGRLVFCLLTLLHFGLLPPLKAQTLTVDEVIQRIREAREKTRDFTADLLQEKKLSLLKEKVVSRGRIRFKAPDRIFIEFFHPEAIQMAFDGKTFLLYLKEEKVAERYRIQGNPVAERFLIFSKDPFQERLASWKILEDREGSLLIEVVPKGKESLFVKTRLWISKRDWVVTGMELIEKNGDTTLFQYSNVRVNTGLSDSDFEIRLPKDVKVTEVR